MYADTVLFYSDDAIVKFEIKKNVIDQKNQNGENA